MLARVRVVALLAAALFAVAPAAQAAAPTLAVITEHLRTSAQYDDKGAGVTPAQRATINTAISAARAKKRVVRVAILSAAPPDAPLATAATRLRVRLKLQGTIIVALPASVQVASLNVSGKRLAQVRAAADGKGGVAGVRAALTALVAKPAPPVSTTTTTTTPTTSTRPAKASGGGVSKWIYIVAAIVVLGLIVVLVTLRARTRDVRRRGGGSLITGARALLQARLDSLGEMLATTAVGVSEREDLGLSGHHQSAADTVSDVRASIGRLDGPPAFRSAHGRLDDAEWHLGVVQAHLDGAGEPSRPESGHPGRCFFNADHGLATVEIELELPGVRTVSVGICAADAVRLSRGEEPEVGAVTVGRRRLPWAAAPTWYGGWGWGQDDLPSLRYHGQPVFTSRDQLEAFTGSVRVRPAEPDGEPFSRPIGEPVADLINEPDEPVDEAVEPAAPAAPAEQPLDDDDVEPDR
jgi:hypothetical protein